MKRHPTNIMDGRLKHPFTCIVTGPTMSGTTKWTKRLVRGRHAYVDTPIADVIWYDNVTFWREIQYIIAVRRPCNAVTNVLRRRVSHSMAYAQCIDMQQKHSKHRKKSNKNCLLDGIL